MQENTQDNQMFLKDQGHISFDSKFKQSLWRSMTFSNLKCRQHKILNNKAMALVNTMLQTLRYENIKSYYPKEIFSLALRRL